MRHQLCRLLLPFGVLALPVTPLVQADDGLLDQQVRYARMLAEYDLDGDAQVSEAEIMILESSVERPPGCVPRGSWQGITRRNSGLIATSYNAARGCAVRALVVVAGFTQ